MSTGKPREHWASSFGFIMAAAGSAIGLGTLWQFPYMTAKNGGGLFVILFLIFTILIGTPIFIAELITGRKAQRGAVGIFENLSVRSSSWKMVGWLSVLSSFLILSYYCVVAGWCLNYVLMSLNQFYLGKSSAEIANVFDMLYHSCGINLFWQFFFLLFTAGVVYQGIRKGIEYWSRILTSALLVLLLGLLFFSMTLEGFSDAVHFIFYPDFAKLKPSGVIEALGLAFFTLSLGQGIMLTYGSYMSRKEDIPKTACIVSAMNLVVSVLAALMIFPIIFTFGLAPEGGFGLVFQTLPVLFAKLPGSLLLSTLFFILLVFTALTSSVSLLEVIVANFMDLLGWSRKKAVLLISIVVFIFGLPSALSGSGLLFPHWEQMYGKNFFATIVDLVAQWILPIVGLFVSIFVGWQLKKVDVAEEFRAGTTYQKLFAIWYFFTKYLAPVAIFLIILQRGGIIDLDALFK
jgi:neurotransmitter:Na+ symporter, NSS family